MKKRPTISLMLKSSSILLNDSKKILQIVLFTIILLFLTSDLFAGAYFKYKPNCNFQYMGTVHAKIRNGFNAVAGPCTVHYCPTYYNPPAYLHCGNSSKYPGYYYWTNGHSKWGIAGANLEITGSYGANNGWYYEDNRGWSVSTGGDYFYPLPIETPADSDNVCGSWADSVNIIYDNNNHKIILNNIYGGVKSSGENYTSVFYILVYKGDWNKNEEGKYLKSQIISKSYIKIENGKVSADGLFSMKDLRTSTFYFYDKEVGDSLLTTKGELIPGTNKTISIPEDISMDDVTIVFLGESGYGSFIESLLIVEDESPIHCEDFHNTPLQNNVASVGNWSMYNYNGASVTHPSNISIVTDPDPYRGKVITASDASGGTYLINTGDYDGNWIENGNTCFCFYLKLISDGGSYTPPLEVKNSIYLFNNLNINSTVNVNTNSPNNNPKIGFQFILNNTYNENTPWQRICLPINTINDGDPLPSNSFGYWQPYGQAMGGLSQTAAWNFLIQNITEIGFFVDATGQNQQEIIGVDSICVGCDEPTPPCNEFEEGELNIDCCQYKFNVNNSIGNIKKIEYSLTGGTIVSLTTTGCSPTTSPISLFGTTTGTLNYTPACNVNQTFLVEVLPNTGTGLIHIDWVVTHTDGSICNYSQEYVCNPMPITRCDRIRVAFLAEPDVNMTGRTITIFNEKIPVSPIDYVKIEYLYTGTPPEPLPLNRSGGHLQVDNEIGGTYYRPWYQNLSGNYTYFPEDGHPWLCQNPIVHENPSDSKIRFNLKYDWTAGWVGKIKFTIHHCDNQECYREFTWNGNAPWIPIIDMTELDADLNHLIIGAKIIGSKNLPKDIAGVSFTILNPDTKIVAATTPFIHGAERNPDILDVSSSLTSNKSATFEFVTPLVLKEGESSPKVNLVVLREKGSSGPIKLDISFFDSEGNGLGHDTTSIAIPVGIIDEDNNISLKDIRLNKCIPTPSSDYLKLYYDVMRADNITIKLFNNLGEEIKLIERNFKDIGSYDINVSTIGLPSGTYYIKMSSSTSTSTLPVVIRK